VDNINLTASLFVAQGPSTYSRGNMGKFEGDKRCVNGPCLLDYLILQLRLPVVLYVSFAVDS